MKSHLNAIWALATLKAPQNLLQYDLDLAEILPPHGLIDVGGLGVRAGTGLPSELPMRHRSRSPRGKAIGALRGRGASCA